MIKARGTRGDGKPVIIIGLSAGNVERLKVGKPILFDLADIGLEGSVTILYGETEQAIAEELVGEGLAAGATVHRTDPPKGSIERPRH